MKNDILFLGDSHSIHCFANGTVDVFYLIDVTLNKIRQHNSNLFVKYGGFFPLEHIHKYEIVDQGDSILDIINNSNYEFVLLTVGEIDVRFHSSKLSDDYNFLTTLESFSNFIKKINKKVIIMNIIPPGHTSDDNNLHSRIILTRKINSFFEDFTNKNNYLYFNIYDDFVNDGILDCEKSDGGVHISKSFQSYILEKLKNYIS